MSTLVCIADLTLLYMCVSVTVYVCVYLYFVTFQNTFDFLVITFDLF